jgi:hypothetical protein
MTAEEELGDFLAQLRAAGQPWNRWGIWGSFIGVFSLLALQVAHLHDIGVIEGVFVVVIAVLAVSWTCLIIAFVKRRRWEKAHPLTLPSMSEPQAGES